MIPVFYIITRVPVAQNEQVLLMVGKLKNLALAIEVRYLLKD